MAMPATYSALDLTGSFILTSPTVADISLPITLPGDVHTALLAADRIPDPYFGENEKTVMWVNETAWTLERRFDRVRRVRDEEGRPERGGGDPAGNQRAAETRPR